jgi:TorA maturation chaperone TorD
MNTNTDHFLKARSNFYQIISALLCEPESEYFDDGEIFNNLKESIGLIQPELCTQVDLLAENFSKKDVQQHLVDHTKLFLGPFEAIAYPYSSIYFGEEKGLLTEVTSWVESYYNQCSLSFDKSLYDLPDHIVVELEFVYNLAFHEWEALSQGNKAQADTFHEYQRIFILKHLGIWCPKMCDEIIKSELSEFYSVLAKLLKSFLQIEVVNFSHNPN